MGLPQSHDQRKEWSFPNAEVRSSTGVAAHGPGQCEQDFHLAVIHTLEHLVNEHAGGQPENQSSANLLKQEHRNVAEAHRMGWNCRSRRCADSRDHQQHQKDDHSDAIVEQRFPGDLDFKLLGGLRRIS